MTTKREKKFLFDNVLYRNKTESRIDCIKNKIERIMIIKENIDNKL